MAFAATLLTTRAEWYLRGRVQKREEFMVIGRSKWLRLGAVCVWTVFFVVCTASLHAVDETDDARPADEQPESTEVEFLPFPPGVGPGSPDDDIIPVVPIPEFVDEDGMDAADPFAGVDETDKPPAGADKDKTPAKNEKKDEKGIDPKKGDAQKDGAEAAKKDPPKKDPVAKDVGKQGKPVENPFRQVFEKVFGPPAKPKPEVPAVPPAVKKPDATKPAPETPSAKTTRAKTVSDTRVAHDRRKLQWLSSAEQSLATGDWNEAVKWYQQILDHSDDALHRLDSSEWVPLKRLVRMSIATGPTGLREAYRTQFDGLAKKLYEESVRRGDEAGIAHVATAYFPTEAGQLAANRLGTQALDRGDMAVAAQWFEELWKCQSPLTRDRKWQLKAVVSLSRARMETAKEVITAIGAGSAPVNPQSPAPGSTEWLEKLTEHWPAWSSPVLGDWLVPFGDSGRTARAQGGDPLLIPRWTSSITDSQPVRSQVEDIVQALQDGNTPTLTAAHTVLVDGKVAFRTLAGVRVVEAESGKLLWQTDDGLPLEEAISAAALAAESGDFAAIQRLTGNSLFADNAFITNNGQPDEYKPLTHLLFRNSNFGSISSDSTNLFVLTDVSVFDPRQPGQTHNWEGRDASRGPGNLLQAYRLATGQVAWEVGGATTGAGLELPLAGYFFFGPPVAVDGELLVVAEADKDIRLLALNPVDGSLNWSLLLGHADADIGTDLGRRWWSAPIAESEGVLVCPTTTGWVMGVDRRSRSLLWGHRVSQPQKSRDNPSDSADLVQMTQLGSAWAPSAPMLVDGRVVLTPPEANQLVCLDLASGKKLWSLSRNNLLETAGLSGTTLVLIGPSEARAVNVAKGETAWTIKTGAPAGRGVVSEGSLYLPLRSGEVRRIAMEDGKTLGSWFPGEAVPPLGNLGMYRGLLVSHGPLGVTAFELEDAVRKQIAELRAKDPTDAAAAVSEARVLVLQRDHARALPLIENLASDKLTPSIRAVWRRLLFVSLLNVLRNAPADENQNARIERLVKIAENETENIELVDLRARRAVTRGQYTAALELYAPLIDKTSTVSGLADADSSRTVRTDAWLAGRMKEVLRSVPESTRDDVARFVERKVQFPAEMTLSEQHRRLRVWQTHPAGREAALRFVDRASAEGNFAAAQRWLAPWLEDADASVAARFHVRTARLFEEKQMWADAEVEWRRIAARFGSLADESGKNLAELAAEHGKDVAAHKAASTRYDWEHSSPRVEIAGLNHTTDQDHDLTSLFSEPFFREFEVQVSQQEQRLELFRDDNGQVVWSQPLRSRLAAADYSTSVGEADGHFLVVLHRGVLHGVSVVDRKILWTHTVDMRGSSQNYSMGNPGAPPPQMKQVIDLTSRLAAQQPQSGQGMLALATREVAVHLSPRMLRGIDSLTGDVLWTRACPKPGSVVYGNGEVLYLRTPDSKSLQAIRAVDGEEIQVPALTKETLAPWLFVGHRMLLQRSVPGPNLSKIRTLELFDPLTDSTLWTAPLASGTLCSPLDNRTLILVGDNGEVRELDLNYGKESLIGTVPPDDFKSRQSVFAIADDDQAYLIINSQRVLANYPDSLPSIVVNGKVVAFDRRGKGWKWTKTVANQSLVVERFRHNPLLVFATRRYVNQGGFGQQSLSVLVIDKLSGARLAQESRFSHGGFRTLHIERTRPMIELRSHSERLRIVPNPGQANADGGKPPAGTAEPKKTPKP